jgi:hypothetical protein
VGQAHAVEGGDWQLERVSDDHKHDKHAIVMMVIGCSLALSIAALLHSSFPLVSAVENPTPRDEASKPFGFITALGLLHMTSMGQRIRQKLPFVSHSDHVKVLLTRITAVR